MKALSNHGGGGAERVLTDVVNGLVARGHEVKVLTFDPMGKESFYPLDSRIGWIQLGIGSTIKTATVVDTMARIQTMRREITKVRPDVVIGFMHSMFLPLGMALFGTGIPVVASEHIVPEHYRTRTLERLLLRLTPYLVSSITCVSPHVRELYPPALRAKMVPIANPVTIDVQGKADVIGGERKTILTVGRLEEQKDQATLIKAFALVAEEFADWDLRIVGGGSLGDGLKALAADLGIAARVQIPGARKDIASEYRAAQLFALPSRYESFGLTLVEAFAHGLPAFGFDDCPGVNMLIKPGVNGLLISPGSNRVEALAAGMRALLGDPQMRKSLARNTTRTSAQYALGNVLDEWERMLGATIEA